MTVSVTTDFQNAALQGRLAFLDAGPNHARLRLYGGTRRALPTDTPTSAMLAQITLTKPAGVVSAGTLTLTQDTSATDLVALSGIVTWATLVTGNEITAADFDCTAVGGAGEVQLDDVQVYAGGRVDLVSCVLG